MKISTILDHIDSGYMALPEFQRGYVWNRDQVRGLMSSLYRRLPVGSLLVWATESQGAKHRGDGHLAGGIVKLLLDGQQRITSLYGVARGKPPRFFDGNAQAFTGLFFHLDTEEFEFYSPVKMKGDPLWVDVSKLMLKGVEGFIPAIASIPALQPRLGTYLARLSRIKESTEVDLHVEEVTGADKSVDVVVEIFNRVNSGGTKLSKGDLALAKICAEMPEARERMKQALARWRKAEYHFDLDWLLRNVNTVATGEAKFGAMHALSAESFESGLERTEKAIDYILNLIAGKLGLDHDRVLFGRYGIPVMAHYVDRRGAKVMDEIEQDRLLFWYLQSALWGRFSGSTESFIDKDLAVIESGDDGLDRLIAELRFWRGGLGIQPEHFGGWSLGARFYPMLYLLTRMGEARDWGTGLPLKAQLLGRMSKLEVHHVFPKSVLYARGYSKPEVNAVANFCFQTKDTNLEISDRPPEGYFPDVEQRHPGALRSQWIPMDPKLWRIECYRDFLDERKRLLAGVANDFLSRLYHGDEWAAERLAAAEAAAYVELPEPAPSASLGGVESDQEEAVLEACNQWVEAQGLPSGIVCYELTDPETGASLAVFDLAWPSGLQPELSQPVAVLIGESAEVHKLANARGYRFFTSVDEFKAYVEGEILARAPAGLRV